MKNIIGEAILFDMYYMAQDPVPLAGEKREAPKVQMLPVTEATPQFRNFYVSNVFCDGAEKAVFIRGLPEMNIRNIELKNMIIQARHGIELSEATGITFKNVEVVPQDTNPVVNIVNSKSITFDKLKYPMSAELLFRVGGDRTSNISVTNTNTFSAKQKTQFEFGAKEEVLTIK